MINKILMTIIKVIVDILAFILNIIFLPLTAILDSLFPNLTSFANTFNSFLNTYLFKGLAFAREVIINIFGFNRDLLGILFAIPLTYFGFYLANTSIRLLVSIYRIWKGKSG